MFAKWVVGLNPKEHRDMFDRQWMIDRDERLTREMREREDRRDREARERHHHELVVFGLILGGLTVLGSMIEAGWLARPW